jgi:hypothetical protein
MRWTKEPPRQNGWYWYKPTNKEKLDFGVPCDRQQIVEIENLFAQFPCYKDALRIEDLEGDWAGRIETPSP